MDGGLPGQRAADRFRCVRHWYTISVQGMKTPRMARGGGRRQCGAAPEPIAQQCCVYARQLNVGPPPALRRSTASTSRPNHSLVCVAFCRHHRRSLCSNRIPAARHHQDTITGAQTSHCGGFSAAEKPCRQGGHTAHRAADWASTSTFLPSSGETQTPASLSHAGI